MVSTAGLTPGGEACENTTLLWDQTLGSVFWTNRKGLNVPETTELLFRERIEANPGEVKPPQVVHIYNNNNNTHNTNKTHTHTLK